jgi:hypothetical protein
MGKKLKKCPFCKKKPSTFTFGDYTNRTCGIGCIDIMCPVQPVVIDIDFKNCRKRWNTRGKK